ncbi:MAG: DEAD/DEAH box helicase, partial [Candidatus Hodarchaeales archaeon]
EFRNPYICTIANLLSKRGLTLIMVQRIPHAQKLYELLKHTDNRVRMISGETSTYSEREEVIEMMRREELDIVICTDVIQKGIDIKPVQNVILAGGGKAYCAQYQRIGRGSRPFGDGILNIVTFIDNDCSARKYLRGHSLQMKRMLSENKEFNIKTFGHQEFLDKLGRGDVFAQKKLGDY